MSEWGCPNGGARCPNPIKTPSRYIAESNVRQNPSVLGSISVWFLWVPHLSLLLRFCNILYHSTILIFIIYINLLLGICDDGLQWLFFDYWWWEFCLQFCDLKNDWTSFFALCFCYCILDLLCKLTFKIAFIFILWTLGKICVFQFKKIIYVTMYSFIFWKLLVFTWKRVKDGFKFILNCKYFLSFNIY